MSNRVAAVGGALGVVAIVLVLVANPVFLHFGKGTVAGYWSDSVSYATLARRLFDGGKLYLDGWSHVDTGLILPPLLPLLEALGGGWSENANRCDP